MVKRRSPSRTRTSRTTKTTTRRNPSKRIVALPSSSAAVLLACYDVFGCTETTSNPGPRTDYIQNLIDGMGKYHYIKDQPRQEKKRFKDLRSSCIDDFQGLLANHGVTVGLAAIHNFRRPGGDNRWQRHGIQASSAALESGTVIAAAHFEERLPQVNKSTLCAESIPREYLSDKPFNKRKIDEFSPKDGFYAANETALVRLFEF